LNIAVALTWRNGNLGCERVRLANRTLIKAVVSGKVGSCPLVRLVMPDVFVSVALAMEVVVMALLLNHLA
jgi:hypothetical protein